MAEMSELVSLLKKLMKQEEGDPLSKDVTPSQVASAYGTITNIPPNVQTISIPFQHHKYNLNSTNSGLVSCDIASDEFMKSYLVGWRFAVLEQLEAVFMPNHAAIKHPFTVETIWTPQSTNLTAKNISTAYGSQMMVLGGKDLGNYVVKCGLKSINPRIRDSVNYNDTPRFYTKYFANKDYLLTFYEKDKDGKLKLDESGNPIKIKGKKEFTTCRVYFRGRLRLSAPAYQFDGIEDTE